MGWLFFLALFPEHGIIYLLIFPEVFHALPVFKRSYRLRTSRRMQAGVIFLLTLLLLGGGFFQHAVTAPYNCRIVEDVTLDGISLGGITRSEARKALETAAEEPILSQPLTVVLPQETLTLAPNDVELKSSTLYNCVLLADLEVTERVFHGLLVNYLPIGMDAAVNWATQNRLQIPQ